MLPKTENPWSVESIYTLQYFICPSCLYKHVSKQNFVCHAFETHPESVNYLKNIKDGSLCDVLCPWDSKNYNNDDDNTNSIDISEVIPLLLCSKIYLLLTIHLPPLVNLVFG